MISHTETVTITEYSGSTMNVDYNVTNVLDKVVVVNKQMVNVVTGVYQMVLQQ